MHLGKKLDEAQQDHARHLLTRVVVCGNQCRRFAVSIRVFHLVLLRFAEEEVGSLLNLSK